jgi:hypothetical protein
VLSGKSTKAKLAGSRSGPHDDEKAVRSKLGEAYEHAPDRESAALVPGRKSWHTSRPINAGEAPARPAPPPADAPERGPPEQIDATRTT